MRVDLLLERQHKNITKSYPLQEYLSKTDSTNDKDCNLNKGAFVLGCITFKLATNILWLLSSP